jgi:hypothetical protein
MRKKKKILLFAFSYYRWNRIFTILNEIERVYFMIQIKYYISKSDTSFKILNDVGLYILLDS